MTPQRIGRWRIEGLLGRGGMGSVYRAVDPETGQRAALKTLGGLARAGDVASLRREVRALGRIRHPGIVPILDEGEDDGLPWYAMELVEGMDLQTASESTHVRSGPLPETADLDGSTWHTLAGELPAPSGRTETPAPPTELPRLDWVIQVARELCDALGYLHGEGLVHRDLKPANVVIRTDDRPVLVDFGLSVGLTDIRGRERARVGGSRAGTPWFMAPEQVRGKAVDPRTDLYALGCLIVQLVTGQPPFPEADALAAMTAHLTQQAPRLDERAPGCPGGLADLVEQLLAKRPSQRPGYASDVAHVLEGLGATPPRTPGPAPRTWLHRPTLVGRGPELQRLAGVVSVLAGRGPGGTLWVRGEGGVGKSRLMSEVLTLATERGVQVRLAHCEPAGTRGLTGVAREQPLYPVLPVLQAIVDEARELGPERVTTLFGAQAATLAPYVPAVDALALGGPTPRSADREQERAQVVDAVAAVIRKTSTTRPALWFFDDLQWADGWTLSLLEALCDEVPAGILVAGTWRSEEAHARLDQLWERGSHREELGRLPVDAVGEIAASMLAAVVPEPFAIWLGDRSEGNPFYVGQYLESAVETGLLTREDHQWTLPTTGRAVDALPVPPALGGLLEARLDRLGDLDRQVVRGLAVLGREARLPDLAAVLDPDPEAIAEALARAERAHLVTLHPDGLGARFVHDRVREVAYRGLGPEAAALHRRAAAWLEAKPDRARWLSDLATHWARAGEAERARPLFAEAARAASARTALAEHERLTRAYLAAGPLDEQGFRLFANLVHGLLMARPYADDTLAALDEAEELARILDTPGAGEDLALLIALKHTLHRQSDLAEEVLGGLAEDAVNPVNRRKALEMVAVACQRRGDLEGAVARRRRAATISEQVGDRRAELLQYHAILDLYGRMGRFDDASALLEVARPDPEHATPDEATRLLSLESLLLSHLGQYRDALEMAIRGEQLCRELRMYRRRATFGVNGGFYAAYRGESDLAEKLFASALEVAREPFLRFNIQVNQTLGEFFCELDGAEERFAEVVGRADREGRAYWSVRGRHWQTWMAAARGDVSEALERLEGVDRTRFTLAVDLCEHQLLRARVARMAGDLDEAERLLDAPLPRTAWVVWGIACERVHLALARGEDPGPAREAALALWREIQLPDSTRWRRWLPDGSLLRPG